MVLILPDANKSDGDQIAISLNYDIEPGFAYGVPLSSDGNGPATHYGCRPWVTPGFIAMVGIAKTGVVPDGTSQEISSTALWVRSQWPDAIAALIADARDTDHPYDHWSDVLTAHGLQVIHPEFNA